MTILDDLAEALPKKPTAGFVSFTRREARAIKRAAKEWPEQSLGRIAANCVRGGPYADGSLPFLDGDDAHYLREAILGRHYARGVYRL